MNEILEFSLVSTVITTLSGVVMWHFSKKDLNPKEIYNEGISLYNQKMYKEAIAKFKLITTKYPNYFNAYYNWGLAELKQNSYAKAKDVFTKALEINKKDVDTLYNLAYVEMQLKNYEKAAENFNIILKSFPDDADTLFNLGYIYKTQNDYDKAKEYICKSISLEPDNLNYKRTYLELLELIANDNPENNILEDLLANALELLKSFPEDEKLLYTIADTYSKMADWDNSITYCEQLLNIKISYKTCALYGMTLFCKGENEKAVEMYEKAIELAPNIPDTYMNLVFAYDKLGDIDSAINLAQDFADKFTESDMVDLAKDFISRKEEERDQKRNKQ